MANIASIVVTALLFVIFLFIVIGTGIPFFTWSPNGGKLTITLWEAKTEFGGQTTTTKVEDLTCGELKQTLQAGEAFAILSIFTSVAALALGILDVIGKAIHKLAAAGATVLTFVFSLIVWAAAADVYGKEFCGSKSFKDTGMEYAGGFGLFVTAWCLCLVAIILSVVLPKVMGGGSA